MRRVVGLLAVILLAPAASAQAPEQVHVTLGATQADEDFGPPEAPWLRVQWMTRSDYPASATPVVRFSVDGGPQQTVDAISHGFVQGTTGSLAGADYEPVTRHGWSALLQTPRGSNVSYQVGIEGAMSDTFDVRNLQADPRLPVRLVALGNTYYDGCDITVGTCPEDPQAVPTLKVREIARSQQPHLLLHTGGVTTSGTTPGAYDAVFGLLEPLWATVPVAVAPSPTDDADDFAYFNTYWRQPGIDHGTVNVASGGVAGPVTGPVGALVDGVDDEPQNYYGFSAGRAYVVVLNTPGLCRTGTEIPYGVAPVNDAIEEAVNANGPCEPHQVFDVAQLNWLHDTLEDAREDLKAKWIIAVLGTGPYHYDDDAQRDLKINQFVVPLLESFNVDLVLSSNVPGYQRSYPLWQGFPTNDDPGSYTQEDGPVYVVTGGGGRALAQRLTPQGVPWMAVDAYEHHVTVLDISNETLAVQAIGPNGTVLDAFTIQASGAVLDVPEAKKSPVPLATLLLGLAAAVRRRVA